MIEVIRTGPGETPPSTFEEVVKDLYASDSPRGRGGHEPDPKHREGSIVVTANGRPSARCTLYINPHLHGSDERTGVIGSYECANDPSVAEGLWEEVHVWAHANGLQRLIGPMEGSTWNSYRFSDGNTRPNFFLEPYHHAYYPDQWRAAGFEQLARYRSNIQHGMEGDGDELARQEAALLERGASIRTLDRTRMEDELLRLGHFSIQAFADNILYSPITAGEFVAKYARVRSFIDPDLVLLLSDAQQELLAFVFAIRDHFDPDGRTLIIKSIARRKDAPIRGLGALLWNKMTLVAREKGYKAIIHAFMHEDAHSLGMSSGALAAEPYGSYTLFSKRVGR